MNEPHEIDLSDAAKTNDLTQLQAKPVSQQIARLVREQPYGVLCTQAESQPYGSLVALGVTHDLTAFVFSTPIATRKYRLLSACNQVALVIDSRSGKSTELMEVEAVTAMGRVHRVVRGPDFARWANLLLERHPHLAEFVNADSSALFRVDIERYCHVCHFQDVQEWVPGHNP